MHLNYPFFPQLLIGPGCGLVPRFLVGKYIGTGIKFSPVVALLSAVSLSAAPIDYLRDVKPILTQHCVRCHGAEKEEAGLRLDTGDAAHVGGYSGPAIKSTNPDDSLLLQLIGGPFEDIPQMPYKKPALTPDQIAILRAWVHEGAEFPENETPGKFVHWSFIAPVRTPPPPVVRADWPRNAIDRFVLARLERDKIAPSAAADSLTLLRRVSLDLTGLPPTPAETRAFLEDLAPNAYERVVERLLASPHHGVRWARPWLDAARYSDSNGYSIDAPRQIWMYRDWVVNALNRDLPFNQFVIEQLAGDLIPETPNSKHQTPDSLPRTQNSKLKTQNLDRLIATGFNRNTQINQEGGIDPEQFRIESVLDRVDTFGTAFLGLTIACAQCHDHKFDPITQKDYYKLYAFFNNTVEDGHGERSPGGALLFPDDEEAALPIAEVPARLKAVRAALVSHFKTHADDIELWRRNLPPEEREKLPKANLRAAAGVPWSKQSFGQRRAFFPVARPEDGAFQSLNEEYTRLERRESRAVSTLIMQELPEPRESVIFIKGDFTRRGDLVTPGTPAVLPPLRAEKPTRLDLARWTVDPANPLTARVFVNRIWQQYFGRGLVETENDFGTQGESPTHPELLDWLATEFMAQGWSMKAMHRLIITSATYRQASHVRPDLEIADPINKLLARQSRLRLDAEIVRDVALSASGRLVPQLGGPPVFPPQPDGVMTLGQVKRTWKASEGEDRYRRGLYTHLWRATPHPAFAVFDAPDGFSACTRRLRSNTPLQALTLLNDRQFYELAGALAQRVQQEADGPLPAQIDYAFQLCLARTPAPDERQRLIDLFNQQFAAASGDDAARRNEAWTIVARVLLNLDETITRE